MSNPYTVLGLAQGASAEEIKSAYRREAMKCHPDRPDGNKDRFHEVQNAYDDLTKPQASRHEGMSFHDIFEQQFSEVFSQFKRRNSDVQTMVEITMEQSFEGCSFEVRSPSGVKMAVSLPPGISHGQRMRVAGAGEKHDPSLAPGDLYVVVLIAAHERFRRHMADIVTDVEIDAFTAMLGTKVEVTNLDGEKLFIEIPAGTQFGDTVRLEGKGFPHINSAQRGTFHAQIAIRMPTNLNDEQRELVQQISDLV